MADRITRQRTKGWRKPEGAVIVTRPTIWGNPWGIGKPGTIDLVLDGAACRFCTDLEITQVRAKSLYRDWLETGTLTNAATPQNLTDLGQRGMIDHLHGRRKLILSEIHTLRGRDLCCFCKPGTPCHADVLMEIANG